MMRDERFYAFIVAQTSRSRSRIRRISIQTRLLKALALFAVLLGCSVLYGIYSLTHAESSGALVFIIIFFVALAILGFAYYRTTKSSEDILKPQKTQKLEANMEGGEWSVVQKEDQTDIPKFTESLFCIFLPKKDADNILGDLLEEFLDYIDDSGRLRARLWLYKQLIKSVLPLLESRVRQAILNLSKSWRRS